MRQGLGRNGKGKRERGGRTAKAGGKGSLRREKGGKGNGGDKSPAWSSQHLGSIDFFIP